MHPRVAAKAIKLQQRAKERFGLRIIITDTLRTQAEQAALYAQGRLSVAEVNRLRRIVGLAGITQSQNRIVTNARHANTSWHGYGLAFDIAVTDITGRKINWTNKSDWNADGIDDWKQVGSLAEECGLEWGGNFKSIYDAPHFQDTFGLTLAQVRAKYPAGVTIKDEVVG